MPSARVLVTLTAEAVVELPPGADAEAYLRERVALEWGNVDVVRLVQPPSVAVEWFEASAADGTAGGVETTTAAEPAAVDDEPLAETAGAIGSALGKVASFVEGIKESLLGGARVEDEGPAAEPEIAAQPAPEPVAAFVEAQAADAAAQPGSGAAANGGRVLDRDELLALLDEPAYAEMIRAAVGARAEALVGGVVAQVVAELEPLLRRHLERHGA